MEHFLWILNLSEIEILKKHEILVVKFSYVLRFPMKIPFLLFKF